jgi:FHA domain-containing protein/uncharacterized protein DUF1707
MATEAPTPLPARASDDDRERAARVLRDSSAAGRISVDTFSRRLERAYEARSRAELGDLVSDVRPRGRAVRFLTGIVEGASALAAEAEAAWRRPRVERLALPPAESGSVTIGRGPGCDCVVSDPTVSRRHAELRSLGGEWILADLGSTNGTRVNGWRLTGSAAVRPGDEVAFGSARFRLGR